MNESTFKTAVSKTIKENFPHAHLWSPADSFTLGVPDILAIVPARPFLAVETKALLRLLDDPMSSRRTEPLLHHPFTGPQISTMRSMQRAGAEVYGLVRVTKEHAFRVNPLHIPVGGNFTHAQLVEVGVLITRAADGWAFWNRS